MVICLECYLAFIYNNYLNNHDCDHQDDDDDDDYLLYIRFALIYIL